MKIEILIGVPGVGKSTYIENKKKHNDLVLSSDELRVELGLSLYNQTKEEHNIVFSELHSRLNNAIKTKEYDTIYYDATNLSRKQRKHLYEEIKRIDKNAQVSAVCLLKPLKEILKQNNQRTGWRRVPNQAILQKYKSLQVPRIGVDCDIIEKPYGVNFKEFEDEFNYDLEHDSTYHKETVKEHINMCIENAQKTKNQKMIEIAKFHDLGKNICKEWKDENKEQAKFKSHENVSAMYYLANIDLSKDDYKEKLQLMECIYQHIQAHQGFSDKVIQNNKLDKETLDLIEQFRQIDDSSKIAWKDDYVPSSHNNELHFNPNKGKWEKCNATKRQCPFNSFGITRRYK